jgi:hypothetical protein
MLLFRLKGSVRAILINARSYVDRREICKVSSSNKGGVNEEKCKRSDTYIQQELSRAASSMVEAIVHESILCITLASETAMTY